MLLVGLGFGVSFRVFGEVVREVCCGLRRSCSFLESLGVCFEWCVIVLLGGEMLLLIYC